MKFKHSKLFFSIPVRILQTAFLGTIFNFIRQHNFLLCVKFDYWSDVPISVLFCFFEVG